MPAGPRGPGGGTRVGSRPPPPGGTTSPVASSDPTASPAPEERRGQVVAGGLDIGIVGLIRLGPASAQTPSASGAGSTRARSVHFWHFSMLLSVCSVARVSTRCPSPPSSGVVELTRVVTSAVATATSLPVVYRAGPGFALASTDDAATHGEHLPVDEGVGDHLPGGGENAGEGRPGYAHAHRSLFLVEAFDVGEAKCLQTVERQVGLRGQGSGRGIGRERRRW